MLWEHGDISHDARVLGERFFRVGVRAAGVGSKANADGVTSPVNAPVERNEYAAGCRELELLVDRKLTEAARRNLSKSGPRGASNYIGMTLLHQIEDVPVCFPRTLGGILESNKEPAQRRPGQSLASAELAATRLDLALGSEDTKPFMIELGKIIKARGGYAAAARAAGPNRTALYKIISAEGNPALKTLVALLTPLGLRLSIKPIMDEEGQSDT